MAWQKQQRALEAAAERSKRAAEEARARAAEQENAAKQVAQERQASQQDRCGGRVGGQAGHASGGCKGGPCWARMKGCNFRESRAQCLHLVLMPCNCLVQPPPSPGRRQAEADMKAREAKLAAALEEAGRLRK